MRRILIKELNSEEEIPLLVESGLDWVQGAFLEGVLPSWAADGLGQLL